jgi:uncharacterized membrane protein
MQKTQWIEAPLFQDDIIVFGILMAVLAFVFYTSQSTNAFWKKFYTIFPSLLMCYLLPSILSSLGIIAPEWHMQDAAGNFVMDDNGEAIKVKLSLYYISSRLLLPAALVLLILSVDIKALLGLGNKALIMFFTGTAGIILGGPLAILIVGLFSPETVGGEDAQAVWRGLTTVAGSWIGGGANQAAMLEIYKYDIEKFGSMLLVDIVVANIWMAFLLWGIGRKDKIDRWLRADNSAIENLKIKVTEFADSVNRIPTLKDLMIILGIAFLSVTVAHLGAQHLPRILTDIFPAIGDKSSMVSTFGEGFFWLVTIATILGIFYSFTPLKAYEGAGASKLGSVFIYILVATIGMKMDLRSIFDNPGLLILGLVWMAIHVGLLFLVAKIIRAPYFFLAVGSKANVGGAASAPIVASAFHPSLASVGVILAIFGYIIGTYGAILCAVLMEAVSKV